MEVRFLNVYIKEKYFYVRNRHIYAYLISEEFNNIHNLGILIIVPILKIYWGRGYQLDEVDEVLVSQQYEVLEPLFLNSINYILKVC